MWDTAQEVSTLLRWKSVLSGSDSDMWWNPEDTVNAECQDKRWSPEGSGIGGGASCGVTANRKTKGTGRAGEREATQTHTIQRVLGKSK